MSLSGIENWGGVVPGVLQTLFFQTIRAWNKTNYNIIESGISVTCKETSPDTATLRNHSTVQNN